MSFVSRLAQARLDNLEELVPLRFSKDADIAVSPSFTSAPRLNKLQMQIDSKSLPILLPWSQLIELTLISDFLRLTLDILAQCANLTRATIHTTALPDPLGDRHDIIALSHLRILTVRSFRSKSRLIPFLARLSAPMLEELQLDSTQALDRRWTQAHFTEFQLRSPNITRLEVKFSSLTADQLMTAMGHAPSLTHLKLIYCNYCFDNALIDAVRYKSGAVPLAPRLRNLFLEHIGNNFTKDELAGMIASRWWTDAELASRSIPPVVARWTRVRLPDFGEDFVGILECLPSDVLMIH
ncbi:hypothetical protein C8R45DRAFT_609980 [Mycena sanguinolenta]|nr:hypothetical protein C8R45DRAFT_609980 [Mycena sanguinolenta]